MSQAEIEQVRRFHRLVTQRVGALRQDYLARGRPLGEARVLWETGPDGIELDALRQRLALDSGYLSRLLRSLEGQGLVTVGRAEGDGRRRRASLTESGRAERAAYDGASDRLAAALLAGLDEAERRRLVAAMAEVERLLRAAAIVVEPEPAGSADACRCLAEYFAELGRRFDQGFDPGRSISASEAEMTPPAGWLFLARLDGEAVGCGALKLKGDGIGEIKRMWTAPAARRLGVARRLLQAIEAKARECGVTRLRLETNRALAEAQALYRRAGYEEVAAFNDEPYAHHWFEKRVQRGD